MDTFQARNFPRINTTPAAAPNPGSCGPSNTQHEDFDEDDDELGYYPDGVKRTLTDEQVAMFRHSEIYALLRQQQVRNENRDADSDPPSESAVLKDAGNQETKMRVKSTEDGTVDNQGSDDEAEYARFLEAEKRKAEAVHARKKRKMNTGEGHHNRGRPMTHRRIARELDDVAVSEQALDYGEESSIPTTVSGKVSMEDNMHPLDEPKQQLHDSERSTDRKHDLPAEGRKIWWPIIGT